MMNYYNQKIYLTETLKPDNDHYDYCEFIIIKRMKLVIHDDSIGSIKNSNFKTNGLASKVINRRILCGLQLT